MSASMPLPEGVAARPMCPDDIEAVAQLLTLAEAVDATGEFVEAEDLREWWVDELVDLASDSQVVLSGDGEVVGYATAIAPPTFRDAFDVYLEGRVHPGWRGRGIGRSLLAWQLGRGAELHAERHPGSPARLTAGLPTSMPSAEALMRRAGLSAQRWYFHMTRPLADLPEPRPVEGVELTPFSWDRDDEVRQAHNAAFAEHHGSSERDVASWQVMFTGQRSFRPDLSVLALEGGAVVGYALVYVYAADTAARGYASTYFGQIGVLPHARGRGLSKAAIVEALRQAATDGCRVATLQVDSENVTGALGLYEGLGFTTERTLITWSRMLDPLP